MMELYFTVKADYCAPFDVHNSQIELISVVSNLKGENQALSIRIHRRYSFNVFLASHEKMFLIKCHVFT